MALRGFIPPDDGDGVRYNYLEGQEKHRFRDCVLIGPPEIILVGAPGAQRRLEAHGLDEVDPDVAARALEAYQAGDDVAPILELEREGAGTDEDVEDDDGYVCGAETSSGGECQNPVAAEGDRCHAHPEDAEDDAEDDEDDEDDEGS